LVIMAAITMLVAGGYVLDWSWTGFGDYVTPSASQGQEFQRGKTLWDWLDLLIVPVVLAVGGLLFKRAERQDERAYANQRVQHECEMALDRQRENALQIYLDRMSDLLLTANLRESTDCAEVRAVARSRTLIALQTLNNQRKYVVLRFLCESGLVDVDNPIINMRGSDFRGVDLQRVDLSESDLHEANLKDATLNRADLFRSNLHGVDLSGADLNGAAMFKTNLVGANLHSATLSLSELNEADLTGADLRAAKLKEARLQQAILIGVDLREADLTKADLRGADLSGARLDNATLDGADLSGAYLFGASLRNASLRHARLSEAVLIEADVSNSDMTDAELAAEQMLDVKSCESAIVPFRAS